MNRIDMSVFSPGDRTKITLNYMQLYYIYLIIYENAIIFNYINVLLY